MLLLQNNNYSLSLQKRCELLSLNRSTAYYHPAELSQENTNLMNMIQDLWSKHPFYGYRKLTAVLQNSGLAVNHKRILRLMRLMGIQAIYQQGKLKKPEENKIVYPYLLSEVMIDKPNQVWSTDLTYLRMKQGFMYLITIIDLFSRYIVSWKLLNTLEANDCIEALYEALTINIPDIFNSDHELTLESTFFKYDII